MQKSECIIAKRPYDRQMQIEGRFIFSTCMCVGVIVYMCVCVCVCKGSFKPGSLPVFFHLKRIF